MVTRNMVTRPRLRSFLTALCLYTMAALLHCEQGDEAAARRAWQKLKGSRRQLVAKDCKGLGVDVTKK